MRNLKNWRSYPVHNTIIHDGKVLYEPAKGYYEKFSTIATKYGFVTAIEFNWMHNKGRMYYTVFEAIVNGKVYRADIDEANLPDRNLKWMATHFIKSIKP